MIRKSAFLHCDEGRAFTLFTEHAGEWWPEERRHTGDPKSVIKILESGRFFERARDGREAELGAVRVWEPPRRLVLDFYVGTDAAHPTEVVVSFAPEGDGTRVEIDHRPTAESAALWGRRNGRFEQSWQRVLACWVEAAGVW